jgi:hypothetical protein
MSTALRLVRDSDGGDELPPLVAWELFMRGAGRAERTVGDGLQVILEAHRSGDGPAPRKRERSNGISLVSRDSVSFTWGILMQWS